MPQYSQVNTLRHEVLTHHTAVFGHYTERLVMSMNLFKTFFQVLKDLKIKRLTNSNTLVKYTGRNNCNIIR